MSDRGRGHQEFANWTSPRSDESGPGRAVSPDELSPAAPPPCVSTLPRWRVFSLIAMVAVLGEIAAVTAASMLHLGMTATALALAGVVLSAVWPLTRSAG
jgi:hypothetical protein